MTDLEMTRLAAKAIGKELLGKWTDFDMPKHGIPIIGEYQGLSAPIIMFDPRNNRAQAFELLEKLRMDVATGVSRQWKVTIFEPCDVDVQAESEWQTDLKRAIVECAARYQLEKEMQA